jgi:integrase/recombinase XerD
MLLLCSMKTIKRPAIHEQYIANFRTFLLMRNYALTTVKTYINSLNQYWSFCTRQARSDPQFNKDNALKLWFIYITEHFGAGTVYNQSFSSLKLFYIHILKRDWAVHGILRPRRVHSLPEVMSQSDVDRLLNHTLNLKHKTLFLTLYATGLRVSELVNLKIEDLNSQTMTLKVRAGKGRKDRLLPLSQPLLDVLRQYAKLYGPVVFLFNGAIAGHPLSVRAVQNAFSKAKQKAGLTHKVSAHTLRHAFATHHLDEGTHLAAIKTMLGHTNIKTTARYVHMTVQSLHQFTNPADQLCKKFII